MKKTFFAVFLMIASTLCATTKNHSQRDSFVFAQIKYAGDWDPYPNIWREIMNFLETTTSVKAYPERRVVQIDEKIFNSPFLWLIGKSDFPGFSPSEAKIIRRFIDLGGMIFIDDASDTVDSDFRKNIKSELSKIFPDKAWQKIPLSHALFRSFYLLRGVGGRKIWREYLEGIAVGERFAVILSWNDVSGTWQKDNFGNYLHECYPGKDRQRWESHKLTINLIMYSLTGTYKSDTVHQPFIERKLRQ